MTPPSLHPKKTTPRNFHLLPTTLLLTLLTHAASASPANTLSTAPPLPPSATSTTPASPSPPPATQTPALGPKRLSSGAILACFLAGIVVIGTIISCFVVVHMNKKKRLYEQAEAARAKAARLEASGKGSEDFGESGVDIEMESWGRGRGPPVPPKEMGRVVYAHKGRRDGGFRKGDFD